MKRRRKQKEEYSIVDGVTSDDLDETIYLYESQGYTVRVADHEYKATDHSYVFCLVLIKRSKVDMKHVCLS
jgi:hypothetical protein